MKAVFIDRDGTLIVETPRERVTAVRELELFNDTLDALNLFHRNDLKVIIISNQAGIGEGLIDLSTFEIINQAMLELLQPSGADIVKTYVCPHAANDNCDCRKPKPTMIKQAAEEFDINLKQSFMIGDRTSDIEAGSNAGTKTILVKTGTAPADGSRATKVCDNLLEAAQYVCSQL